MLLFSILRENKDVIVTISDQRPFAETIKMLDNWHKENENEHKNFGVCHVARHVCDVGHSDLLSVN